MSNIRRWEFTTRDEQASLPFVVEAPTKARALEIAQRQVADGLIHASGYVSYLLVDGRPYHAKEIGK